MYPKRRVELGDGASCRVLDRHEEATSCEVRIVEQIEGCVQGC